MDTCLDTGTNVKESPATLVLQQQGLVDGRRPVQMFPLGTPELPLPDGMQRFVNHRGIFHFNPTMIDRKKLAELSAQGRENLFLMLGPYSKYEIALKKLAGDSLVYITEYTYDGIELRSALGTNTTAETQREYFEQTKEPGSVISVGEPPPRIRNT